MCTVSIPLFTEETFRMEFSLATGGMNGLFQSEHWTFLFGIYTHTYIPILSLSLFSPAQWCSFDIWTGAEIPLFHMGIRIFCYHSHTAFDLFSQPPRLMVQSFSFPIGKGREQWTGYILHLRWSDFSPVAQLWESVTHIAASPSPSFRKPGLCFCFFKFCSSCAGFFPT